MIMMRWFSRQKFRLDIGQSFLAVINLGFLVLASSDKISTLVHLPAKVLVPILVPASLFAVWLVGYLLDRFRYYENYMAEMNNRNEMLKNVNKRLE